MSAKRILIVDDEVALSAILAEVVSDMGHKPTVVNDGAAGLAEAIKGGYDLAILDMSLPKVSGLEILRKLKELWPETLAIMVTAYASMRGAVEALSLGAYDYLTKPFDVEEVRMIVERALERTRLLDENRYLLEQLQQQFNFSNVIGYDRKVQEAYVMAAKVADSNASVLILGETGTGKEFLAKAIHYQSPRAQGPFIKVSCAALPETLLESELFGHEKGAFTNAVGRRIGRFEMAHKGTLFLDEIGDISLATQIKLLRVLQEKQFERVGGSETIRVDVRIIAATNRDLVQAIKDKEFREDLYYRLNVVPIKLPPLRERPGDIPALVSHFISKYNNETGKRIQGITDGALRRLQSYHWPGNIRELENTIERAIILAMGSEITERDILLGSGGVSEAAPGPAQPAASSARSLKEVEAEHIGRVLAEVGGNQSRAAEILGIDRKTLRNKIREYGLGS